MSLNKQTILAALEQEDIQFDLFEHEEVLTVEAMVSLVLTHTKLHSFDQLPLATRFNNHLRRVNSDSRCSSLLIVQSKVLADVGAPAAKNLFLKVCSVYLAYESLQKSC